MSSAPIQSRPSDALFPMTEPYRVPRERYFDRAFHEQEKEKLWYKSWLMACRLQEIPEANDFVEFEICDQSVLIIRQPDLSIKAFHNACRHRATQLAKGAGNLEGAQIVCPFHGWRWSTDGSPSFLFGAKGFSPECMKPGDIRLRECKVDTWGACVWINLDPDAGPLMDALQPAAKLLEDVGVENYRVKWWQEVVLNCNWKIGLEAFLEGWHVMETHPQMTFGRGRNFSPDTTEYLIYPNGHSSFASGTTTDVPLDVLIASNRVLVDGQDAMVLDRDMVILEGLRNQLKPGDNVRGAVAKAMRDYNESAGIPMVEGAQDSPFYWAGEVFLFPNFVILPYYGNALSYRFRPYGDDPEQCLFEVWSLTTYPESHVEERATLRGRFEMNDTENWLEIPRQDFGNMGRQQRGMHSLSYEAHRLAVVWENAIGNLHQEIDRRFSR